MKTLSTTKVIMFILCALSVFAGTAQAATLFSDGFESGDFTTGGWIKTSVWPLVDTASAHTGTYGAGLYMTTSGIAKAQSTVGYSTIHVKYWRKTTAGASTETFYCDWSADGGTTWTNLDTRTGTTSWTYVDKTCPAGADDNSGFRVRFRNTSSGGSTSDVARVDDVEITGTPPLPAPGKATSPSPADTAINIGVTTDLSWTAGSDATSHDVYFGTVTPPVSKVSSDQTGTTWDTGTMSNNKTYYWRIDEKNDSNTTTGDVWSFTTKAQVPDVVSMTEVVATTAITDAGLVKGTVTPECSDTVEAGDVISQDPTGGTQVDVGSSVDLVISTGPCLQTISGHITEPDANIPVPGVAVDANNGGGSDITDVNGYYELTVAYGWSGSVALSKTGYTFEPNGREYNNVTTDHNDNYIATLKTFIISGYAVDSTLAPLAGVLVTPDNNGGPFTSKYYGGGSDTTDVNGYYEVMVDYNWSGKVVPSKYAYAFEPNSITYTNVTEDKVETQNYVGTLLTYTITGYIKNSCEVPIAGVLVNADNGGGSDITDADGYYEVWVDYNWSGIITPSKAHYTFDPTNKAYTDVLENKTGQDYEATNIYDLDCDGSIGFGDIAVMSDNWLSNDVDIHNGDFNDDDIVNFLDFDDFALVW